MRRAERGLTLVDIMISTAILVVIVGVAYPGFKIANDTISTSGVRDRLERAGDRILKRIMSEVRGGFIVFSTNDNDHPRVVVRQPETGVDLSEIGSEGGVPWVAEDRVTRYREVETLDEADMKQDINGDGDQTDKFSLGVMECTDDTLQAGFRPIVDRALVVRPLPAMSGDLDGDGASDLMFKHNPVSRTFWACVYLLARDGNGRWIWAKVESSVRLRNVQE
jgi:hypothetical protein